jgi:hypothetical protein
MVVTYGLGHLLLGTVVKQVLSEELNGVVGLFKVGLRHGFGQHERDFMLSQVFDIGVVSTQNFVHGVVHF